MNMMTPSARFDLSALRNEIMAHQSEMEAERGLEEPHWRDLARLFAPLQAAELSGDTRSRPEDFGELVDATQLYAVDALASGIFTDLTNPTNPWAAYTVEDQELARFHPVKQWLEATSAIVSASLSPARSRFYAQAPQWFADLAVFGFGVMSQLESRNLAGFTDRVIPIREVYLAHDADDNLVRVHRKWRMKGRKAKGAFPMLAEKIRDDSDAEFVHAVFPNPRFDPRKPGPDGFAFLSVYLCREDEEFAHVGFFHELPYHVIEWERRASKSYASGPASRARADVASLQAMETAHLTSANFAAQPMILSASEELIAVTDMAPGQVVYGGVSEQGRQLVQPLSLGGDIRLSVEQSKQRREAIREAFHFSLMMLINRPQMTATEVLGFQEERMRQMAPNLTRLQVSGLSPLLFRRFSALNRAGRIPPAPPELEGQLLSMDYLSPMARIQKAARGKAALQMVQVTANVAALDPEAVDNLDGDATLRIIHDSLGADVAMMRDPRAVQAIRAGRRQSQDQAAQLGAMETAAAIDAERAHAEQARTLAGQRGTAA